jgi:hypothetical protein
VKEQPEEVLVPNPIEVHESLDDDLNRIELWTAALSCFQRPAPEYQPGNVIFDERASRTMLNEAGDRTPASLGDVVRNTIEDQPYAAVTIALGLGWLLGRMYRASFGYW